MNTADLERLLAAHEAFLAGRDGGERLDFTQVRLRGVDLSGRKLARATFDGVFEDVRFDRATLEESTFRKAYLRGCSFDNGLLRARTSGGPRSKLARSRMPICVEPTSPARQGAISTFAARTSPGRSCSKPFSPGSRRTARAASGPGPTTTVWRRSTSAHRLTAPMSATPRPQSIRARRPRKQRIKMLLSPGTSPFLRAEPNARTYDMAFDAIPISPETARVRSGMDRSLR